MLLKVINRLKLRTKNERSEIFMIKMRDLFVKLKLVYYLCG